MNNSNWFTGLPGRLWNVIFPAPAAKPAPVAKPAPAPKAQIQAYLNDVIQKIEVAANTAFDTSLSESRATLEQGLLAAVASVSPTAAKTFGVKLGALAQEIGIAPEIVAVANEKALAAAKAATK